MIPQHAHTMKLTLKFLLLVLLLTGCSRDHSLHKQLTGTWKNGNPAGFMSLLADGSFVSSFVTTNEVEVLRFEGTWLVKDGTLVMTSTNISGIKEHEPVGSIDRMKIIQVSDGRLGLVSAPSGMTNYLERK